ncbi:DUF6777 domain-containing protein [Streptomyces sp. NPDC003362]
MTVRVFMRRTAIALVFVLALGGCDRDAQVFVVKAVAAGVPSTAPFFDEDAGLGHDADVRSRPAPGGLQQGDAPGLYGGTKQPEICDVERLEEFLTDPGNDRKAQAWATALDLSTGEIPDFLDRLTPVLLRTDTLVKNHDYKKGKAVPFDALLQAGIAILVDERGLPAVKCSCGNPLRPFEGDARKISVRFEDGNAEWRDFDRSSVVAVRPAPQVLDRLVLVDVEDPGRGIHRPAGTTGEDDSSFDARGSRTVPDVSGTTFGRASRLLAGAGLAVSADGGGLPPGDARVTGSDPAAGTRLPFGEYVTLSVAGGGTGSAPGTSPAAPDSPTDPAPGSAPGSPQEPGATGSGGSAPAGGSSGPVSTPPSEPGSPSSSGPPASSSSTAPQEPPSRPPSSPDPADPSSPPPSTDDPAPSDPPASHKPTSQAPTSQAPTSQAPPSQQPTSQAPPSQPPPSQQPTSRPPPGQASSPAPPSGPGTSGVPVPGTRPGTAGPTTTATP